MHADGCRAHAVAVYALYMTICSLLSTYAYMCLHLEVPDDVVCGIRQYKHASMSVCTLVIYTIRICPRVCNVIFRLPSSSTLRCRHIYA